MIYIVTDSTSEQREIILATTVRADALYTAAVASTPGVLSDTHEGGLHEVFELEDGIHYSPDQQPIARFDGGKKL